MTQAKLTKAGKAKLVQQDLCVSFDLALQRHDNQDSVFPLETGRRHEDLWMRLYYRGCMDGTLSNMESPWYYFFLLNFLSALIKQIKEETLEVSYLEIKGSSGKDGHKQTSFLLLFDSSVVDFPYLANEESNVIKLDKEKLGFEWRILIISMSTLPGLPITVGSEVCFYTWCYSSGHTESKSHRVPALPSQGTFQLSSVIRHNTSVQLACETSLESWSERRTWVLCRLWHRHHQLGTCHSTWSKE